MEFLDVQRNRERTLVVERAEVLGERGEQLLARALLYVERAAVADQRRHVHEAVLLRFVRDPIVIRAVRTHAQTAERKHAGAERAGVQLVEQRVEADLILDVCGVLDDQVRQA